MSVGQGTGIAGYETVGLAPLLHAVEAQDRIPGGSAAALQLASALQTTLEMDKLIEVFSRHIDHLVPHGGISFENRALRISIAHGAAGKHTLGYQLAVAAQTLGQVTVSRRRRFSDAEGELLENLLCCLVYPLRNAIMYHSAVNAALRDPLTGIYNRSSMNSTLIRETELARRHGAPLSLIALDIDHFKHINDCHGHPAGDYVLQSVAQAIGACTRSSDMLFRCGGEEFLLLASNTAREGAMMLAERIRRAIENHGYRHGERDIAVTTSLGVACYRKGDDSETLFEKADHALYAAKAAGRNCVKFHD